VPDLGCSPNAAVAFDFFVNRGLRDYQAAAIIGNLELESRLDSRIVAMDTDNLPHRGIAMWSPARWDRLLALASSTGRDPWEIDTQLEFLWYELQTDASLGLGPLVASPTLESATVVFQNQFERPRPDLAHTDRRINYAQVALFACPAVRPPKQSLFRTLGAAAGVVALVAAAGYSAYRAREAWA
jgi:hypothetical protein